MTDLDTATDVGLWTVLVYIAADNELTPSANESLEGIKLGGSSALVRTVVQIDRSKDSGATRYVGEKGNFSSGREIGHIDTGNPRPLIDFLKWGISRCPAKHYLLVLWGHGAGLDQRTGGFTSGDHSGECLGSHSAEVTGPGPGPDQELSKIFDEGIQEILHDYQTQHYLSNGCLRFALDKAREDTGRTLDLLGLDACLMGMAEIVCDFRDSVLFVITSEDTEPKASWPYKEIINALVGNPTVGPQNLGELIVKDYVAAFPALVRDQGLTLSLCDLRKAPKLIEAVRSLSRVLSNFVRTKGRSAIDKARDSAPRYDRDYIDLQGFCQALLGHLNARVNPEVVESAKAVIAVLKDHFVVYSESVGRQVSHSHGLSIFLPNDIAARNESRRTRSGKKMPKHSGNILARALKPVALIRSSYSTLKFVQETGWAKFLLIYLGQKKNQVGRVSTQGGKMSPKPKAVRKSRKKPASPRKKPSSPRKKPTSPRKKPNSPRKKPHPPK